MRCISNVVGAHIRHLEPRTIRRLCTALRSRPYSSSPLLSAETDGTRVSVKVGLNSSVSLSIHYAPRPSHNIPVIIYLPSLSSLGPGKSPPYPPLPALARAANATVVCLHYRLPVEQPYPSAIHDVLAGYDWVQEHLTHAAIDPNGAYPSAEATSIGVCGELIGGSLACMLALTECRSRKGAVKAAAVKNAVVDWTSIDPAEDNHVPPIRSDREKVAWVSAKDATSKLLSTRIGLLHLRSRLFTRPERYFDPFASPLLFFRTPASELPEDVGLDHHAAEKRSADIGFRAHVKKRRSHRKYPPAGSGLQLPYMRFEVGSGNELDEQGKEMAEVLRKSVKHWEDESYGLSNRKGLLDKIQLVETAGSDLWDEPQISRLGNWFGDVLRS